MRKFWNVVRIVFFLAAMIFQFYYMYRIGYSEGAKASIVNKK